MHDAETVNACFHIVGHCARFLGGFLNMLLAQQKLEASGRHPKVKLVQAAGGESQVDVRLPCPVTQRGASQTEGGSADIVEPEIVVQCDGGGIVECERVDPWPENGRSP